MRRLCLAITAVGVLSLAASGAIAGSPPLVNETQRFRNEPFGGIGLNCATGNLASSNGVFSGVIHTLVKPDGSLYVSAYTRGTDTLDDLPADGIPDATTTFVFNSVDTVHASGKEIHHFTGTGTITVVATNETRRFHAVAQLVLDENGVPKVDFVRLVC